MVAIDEENASLRSERAELHSLLNDTAQELEQAKKELAETAGLLLALHSTFSARHIDLFATILNGHSCTNRNA